MQILTQEGQRIVKETARHYGFSESTVTELLLALAAGQGIQAQFNNPELGGMGQWTSNGMIMIGDMFNQNLKARVNNLCIALASALRHDRLLDVPPAPRSASFQSQYQGGGSSGVSWTNAAPHPSFQIWPPSLGQPASTGAQNNVSYAFFPQTRRLAIRDGDTLTVYDTGGARINGFSQQQGGAQTLTFVTPDGLLRLNELTQVSLESTSAPSERATEPTPASSYSTHADAVSSTDATLSQIEKLGELHQKGVLTDEEFTAKKAELLKRL